MSEKESQRWLSTAEAARTVLARAQMVSEIRYRESDIHEKRARLPAPGLHIVTRAMADRSIEEGGGKLSSAPLQMAGTARVALRARPGRPARTARIAFSPPEIETLHAFLPELGGKTALQKNPHPPETLASAAWIIAKLGGWDGYPKSRPPGPITFRHGLRYFKSLAHGWRLGNG